MSLMMVSRVSPDWRMVLTESRWSGVSGVWSRRLVMPMTPFIGVRISCDMEARKSLLAREAASASILARRSSRSVSTRWVMSVARRM